MPAVGDVQALEMITDGELERDVATYRRGFLSGVTAGLLVGASSVLLVLSLI